MSEKSLAWMRFSQFPSSLPGLILLLKDIFLCIKSFYLIRAPHQRLIFWLFLWCFMGSMYSRLGFIRSLQHLLHLNMSPFCVFRYALAVVHPVFRSFRYRSYSNFRFNKLTIYSFNLNFGNRFIKTEYFLMFSEAES